MGFPLRVCVAIVLSALAATRSSAGEIIPEFFGPSPYLKFEDSPFAGDAGFGFCNETLEDGFFDIPEATGDGSVAGPFGQADSVDADDGQIDGSGSAGRSYFSGAGSITIEFAKPRRNGLPFRVGLVWTDGGLAAPVTFEAFGPDGESIGTVGPAVHADLSNNGETAEDRFYGVSYALGVSKIRISNTAGGIEVDHIQLDQCIVCGDFNFDLRITASDALSTLRTAVGDAHCELCVCDTNIDNSTTATDALAILRKSVGLSPSMNCPSCQFG